jgi:hypothetical protein
MSEEYRELCAKLLRHSEDTKAVLMGKGLWNGGEDEGLLARARAVLGDTRPIAVVEPPSDEELDDLWDKESEYFALYGEAQRFALAVLARWGNTTPQPIPLSERMPGPEDCNHGMAWVGRQLLGKYWEWSYEVCEDGEFLFAGEEFTHWLPASVDYLPARVQP